MSGIDFFGGLEHVPMARTQIFAVAGCVSRPAACGSEIVRIRSTPSVLQQYSSGLEETSRSIAGEERDCKNMSSQKAASKTCRFIQRPS